ncbi:MAG: Prolyl oligopeptidase family protein [Pedosphaera sp.]|nr:Prolyl oligopeptidase family protein [Pedosphaera sp.]
MFANMGMYFLAVNYRGSDGYGKSFSQLSNNQDASKDVLLALKQVLLNKDADPKNVFLYSISSGAEIVYELLRSEPKLWRGAIVESPVIFATK